MELANYAQFTVATKVQGYFCDPYSPWRRGSNENTNGLLRQYYPKGMDLSGVSQAQLDAVAKPPNIRPRKALQWKTPAHILDSSVSTIHNPRALWRKHRPTQYRPEARPTGARQD
jgi:IS30 family transposase